MILLRLMTFFLYFNLISITDRGNADRQVFLEHILIFTADELTGFID